jgi:hypothetical protein
LAANLTDTRLALRAAGFNPIPVHGKRALLEGWSTKVDIPPEEIESWTQNFPRWTNTGIVTQTAPALDIDILHEEAAVAVEELAREWFDGRGHLLVRFGQTPKRALLFRTCQPFPKVVSKFVAPDGSEHKVEFLGDGQQIVVDGIHPDTKRPYAWHGGYAPGAIAWSDLPEIDETEAQSFVKLTSEMLAEKFGFREKEPEPRGSTDRWNSGNGPLDVEACLAAMQPNGESVNDIQPRAVLSLLQKGMHPDDAIAQVVDATMEMADRAGLGWTREVEVRCVTKRCVSSLRKLQSEYDPSTGVIPTWLAGEFHDAWAEALRQGRRPQLSRNPSGFYVRAYGPATNGHDHGAEAGNDTNADNDAGKPKKGPYVTVRFWTPISPLTLPPREWLYGKHYQRGIVSATVAPGGVGKTSLNMVEGIAMATARNLLGEQPTGRYRVWLHNGEDPQVELDRRVLAICQHYEIPQEELVGWFSVTSGVDMPLRVALGYNELKLQNDLLKQIAQRITELEIDVASFDPLVKLHDSGEQSNDRMDTVIGAFASIANACECAIDLSHHTRKQPFGTAADLTADDARGPSSLRDAVRAMRVLNPLATRDAENFGIAELDRLRYLRVDRGKSNTAAPASTAVWRKFVSVDLPNGDDVGVITDWTAPSRGARTPEQAAAEQKAEAVFLRLLDKLTARGTNVSANVGNTYAPAKFASEPEAKEAGVSKAALKLAMGRLLDAGRISCEPHGRYGGHRLVPWQGTPE